MPVRTPLSAPSPAALPGRLRRRLFLYFAAALLALAAGVAAATIIPLLGHLEHAEEAGLSHAAETRALAVGEWYRRAEDLARQITSRSQIRDALADLAAGRTTRERFAAFTRPKLMDAMDQSGEVVGITRLDREGEPLVSCGVDIPRSAWRIPPLGSDEALASPPLRIGNRLCIVVAAPILEREGDGNGERLGTDLVAVDMAVLREKVIRPLGKDDASRLALACLAGERVRVFLPEPDGAAPPPSEVTQRALGLALSGRSGVLSSPGDVAAYTPVAGTNWALAVTADGRRLYAPVRAEIATILGTTAAIYLLCLLGFGILLRPLAGRMLLQADELAAVVEERTHRLKNELAARTAAEKALKQARDELEKRVAERTARLERANAELRALHARLSGEYEERKALSKELINLLEGVRLDVSRDLHDHTGQLLTTLRLHLKSALQAMPAPAKKDAEEGGSAPGDGAACRAQLESAAEKVDQVQREIKTIARGLRPDTLDYLGLVPSLEALLDEQRASSGLAVHFFHNDVPARFDRDKELALYRIAQEALSNVVRHARAASVHVNLVLRGKTLSLSVEDDGAGFDMAARAAGPGKAPVSLGLTLMRERMVQIGGSLSVESAPGQGTHVVAEVEL
ncbi:integral membrane sensor signal transduction histidine kinase [Desulfovibrio sp. X2]|uniref:sensor histidine kinase n=1 Tax=Desulfovibrio sp. X2 TaxID=941449 RepID=UPI00035873AD|nr:ATP-binding protein [Desulfovibrio sp. X2]EPR44539.1 integral membrane sensor signal transduction histidine kinase [Desulfovibrio sp. X2]